MKNRIAAARGLTPCDLILRDVSYLDVFSCSWKTGDISIQDGVIIGVEKGLKGKREIDGKGQTVVPGFIDAHVHVESSLLSPWNFQKTVLPCGTTTAICDPHELSNVIGVKGLQYFLDAANVMSLDLRVMLSSCVPATHLETNGGGEISASQLVPFMTHPKALGLAEMMNFPGVLNGDPKVLEKLAVFSNRKIDGHCPELRGLDLSAYVSTGISSCHESSTLNEASEKLSKGVAIWIREGSVAKDLEALIPLLNLATSTSIGFCTDDRNPLDIQREGHINYLVKSAIHSEVTPEVAYRSASWSVARHYGLSTKGAIAPGYEADLVILNDVRSCEIQDVVRQGVFVSELHALENSDPLHMPLGNSIQASVPEITDLQSPKGQVRVIGVKPGKILTDHLILKHDATGVAQLSVLERYGRDSKPANGYVHGFGEHFRGAIASSVGHDSHNLIVVGDSEEEMRAAIAALIECGGGFCVVQNEKLLARLELPFGGLMSQENSQTVTKKLIELQAASHHIGCELKEPFLQLAFLSLPVIPSLKLTDRGLVDVNAFQFVNVSV